MNYGGLKTALAMLKRTPYVVQLTSFKIIMYIPNIRKPLFRRKYKIIRGAPRSFAVTVIDGGL
jgi:hypothetical protein